MGGGMRQAGYLAAAGIYALEHHIERLQEDHTHALMIEDALREKSFVDQILPVETNIVIASFKAPYTPQLFMEAMKKEDIWMYQISPNQIRMVVHLDVGPELIEKTIKAINKL
jgi:threonine aldolase